MIKNIQWPNLWESISTQEIDTEYPHYGHLYSELTGDKVAATLEEELYRELSKDHILQGLTVTVIAFNKTDPNEYIFQINHERIKFAKVHLTWSQETDVTWPLTETFQTLESMLTKLKLDAPDSRR